MTSSVSKNMKNLVPMIPHFPCDLPFLPDQGTRPPIWSSRNNPQPIGDCARTIIRVCTDHESSKVEGGLSPLYHMVFTHL